MLYTLLAQATEVPTPAFDSEVVIYALLATLFGLILVFGGVVTYALRKVYQSAPDWVKEPLLSGITNLRDELHERGTVLVESTELELDDQILAAIKRAIDDAIVTISTPDDTPETNDTEAIHG